MICLITDRTRLSAGADRVVELVAAAGGAGIDLVQIRERDLDARALAALVARCVRAVEGTSTRIVVNDRADVALAAGAHGVHLRADSITASAARVLVGEHAVVGRSIHSASEAATVAREGGVDYLLFGTLYDTPSKRAGHARATIDELRAACRAARAGLKAGVPVLAIGGMTVERAAEVARAGAAGIAGIGLFLPPPAVSVDNHVRRVAAGLRRTFDTCETVS